MKSTMNLESKPSTRKCARSTSKEKATSSLSTTQRPPDPRVGTRSVNTLSDAQLERKRANDREAQRIIRQRTKEHIETLERQVAELSEQKEQLNKALQHNSELEAQIVVLQRQVEDMALLLQYRQSPGVHGYTDTAPVYGTTSGALSEPGVFSVPASHGYVTTTTVDSRTLYAPYDMHMPLHGHVSHPHAPSSSGVSSIASTSYTDEGDCASVPQKYHVHPGPSAPSMPVYAHQGHPPTSMAMPGHQYHYPASYNADPWSQNRPG